MDISVFNRNFTQELLIAAATLLVTILIVNFWLKRRKLPPGPWGLPFLGYYPFLDTPHLVFERMGKKYGPVFSFRTLGGKLIVGLHGTKMMKEILINRAEEFIGRPFGNNLVAWVTSGIGITQEEKDPWLENRKFFLQTMRQFGVGKSEFEENIHEEIRGMIENIKNESSHKEVDLHDHMAYANNRIISRLLFDRTFEKDEALKEFLTAANVIGNTFTQKKTFLIDYFFSLFVLTKPELRKSKEIIFSFLRNVLKEHEKTFDPENPRSDFVDAYLIKRHELLKKKTKSADYFDDSHLLANAVNLLVEGSETPSVTATSMLRTLSLHADVQLRAQKELDALLGGREPAWADRATLPYLDATVQELYRTSSAFFITTMYSNFKATKINGYDIPERSILIGSLYSIHYDPDIFPDPEKFDPQRYLDDNGKRIKKEGPYAFSLGKRACIGESLGQVEVFLMIASILQHFSLKPGTTEDTFVLVPRS